jgi:hypothetical protein
LDLRRVGVAVMHALKFERVTCSIGVRDHRNPVLGTLAPGRATRAGCHLLGPGPSSALPLLAVVAWSCSGSPRHVTLLHHLLSCCVMLPPAPCHCLSVASTVPAPLSTTSLHRCWPQPVPVSAARMRLWRPRLAIDGTVATYGRAFPRPPRSAARAWVPLQ